MYKYPKSEKLCSRKILEQLVKSKNIISVFPLKVYWLQTDLPEGMPVQSAVSVAKRKFKRAVHRNLLKRRMREAFRLNKFVLYEHLRNSNKQIALLIVYSDVKILQYKYIEQAMTEIIAKLNELNLDSCQDLDG